MNRLRVRLTLAFILVTLVTVATIALFAHRSIGQQFRRYLTDPDLLVRIGVLDRLAAFYQERGSWEEVDDLLNVMRPGPPAINGALAPLPLLLADAQATILYDGLQKRGGEPLTTTERSAAQTIEVQDQIVGYLLMQTPPPTMASLAEQRFLWQLRRLLVIAALVASGLGILLGALFSRSLAAPLAMLAANADAIAARDWSQWRPIDQTTNIGEVVAVTHAFNQMADSLQHAETLRRNLVADVAHELRTPLTVLQGNLRALLDGVYPLEMSEIATLYDETSLLARLVDDLRQLALAEAGQLPLNLHALAIDDLLRATVEKFNIAAESKTIHLALHLPAALPTVWGDTDRVIQVLSNLVSNALRHTPTGGRILLQAAMEKMGETQAVKITVHDSGEGIAAAELPHVFARFYRANQSNTDQHSGAGLGLTIAKTLVEAMRGTIGVESKAGEGSAFWFTLAQAKEE